MSEEREKIYVGSATEKIFDNGDSLINVTLSLDGLKGHFENYGFTTDQGKKKLGIVVSKRKEPDQFGHTHKVMINTYKPENVHRPPETEPEELDEDKDPF